MAKVITKPAVFVCRIVQHCRQETKKNKDNLMMRGGKDRNTSRYIGHFILNYMN